MRSSSPRPNFHSDPGDTERLILRARNALSAGASIEDIVKALGVSHEEAFMAIMAAKVFPLPDDSGEK